MVDSKVETDGSSAPNCATSSIITDGLSGAERSFRSTFRLGRARLLVRRSLEETSNCRSSIRARVRASRR